MAHFDGDDAVDYIQTLSLSLDFIALIYLILMAAPRECSARMLIVGIRAVRL